MLNENYVFKDTWLDGVANILNSISVGWGAASVSFNFENISRETEFLSASINIKKINE